MRILVLGLDCAAPELLFGDERLVNLRRLMEAGCFGPLESVTPPITVPAWMCMATSQDPGSLGIYGFRNRPDHSYGALETVTSRSIRELTIWDQVAREGHASVLVGIPPSYPPRRLNGVAVGCFLTPDPAADDFTHPASLKQDLMNLVGDYPVDVKGFRTDRKDWLLGEIRAMSRKQFAVVRYLLERQDWQYFQFVEIGLDRMHHGFWQFHDPEHVHYVPGNPYERAIRDYYRHLDDEIGRVLELLDDDTAVLVVSDHGAQRLEGGVCINQWLIDRGLLALERRPDAITPFGRLAVDWSRTRAWSEGGYYARLFLNLKDREPAGTVGRADYEHLRDDIKAALEAMPDPEGRPMGTAVYRPEELYRHVRNIAPDLIVQFGDLRWRSIGSVGHPGLLTRENDTGPDGCNHARFGSFILAGPGVPLRGEMTGVHLLDMAPTLLELAGYDIPGSMQGRSILSGAPPGGSGLSGSQEEIVKERLRGLGYI